MIEKTRTHDEFYATEDRSKEPLECFKDGLKHLLNSREIDDDSNLLDIGCASGDFLYYVQTLKPKLNLWGIDVLPQLLEVASKKIPNAKFSNCSIVDQKEVQKLKDETQNGFNFIHLGGVHAIFDDFIWIDSIMSLLAPKGRCVVFGPFNSYPYDVYVGIRKSGDKTIQSGWNTPSENSVSEILKLKKIKHEFFSWSMPFKIDKRPEDPLRAWTIETEEGRLQINGAGLIREQKFLVIDNI